MEEECRAIAPANQRSAPPMMPAAPGFCKKPIGHEGPHETSKAYGSVKWPSK